MRLEVIKVISMLMTVTSEKSSFNMQNLTDKDKVNLEGITFSTLKKLLLISFRIAVNVSSYKEQQINMSNYFDVTIISIDKKKK